MHFCLFPAWLLRSVSTQCENQMLGDVFESSDFQDWLFEMIKDSYAIFASMESAQNAKLINTPNMVELERSNHHHDTRCPNYRQLNLRTFKLFLQRLQEHAETYMKSLKSIPNWAWDSYRCCPDVLNAS
ncbi:Hypothetical predicted protein [Drosophila guanche]|uniref:DUF4734 domain-containing protein n=1 Tax=Drosophila guanche TaxID=7266 RepID=A0A3B0JLN6_DROGU|nr:Hypothetical predicted protein [Drosophila guanche]